MAKLHPIALTAALHMVWPWFWGGSAYHGPSRQEDHVMMCALDLEKAFHTIEFSVLLMLV